MSAHQPELAASLRPLLDRVRLDVTARKTDNGRQSWTSEPLTDLRLAQHLNGGPARGVSQILPGESVTRVAVLDLDSHGGAVGWSAMSDTAWRLVEALQLVGMEPVVWRSSGGRGIHLYMLWQEPQDAFSVRELLRRVLGGCGLKSGTKGVGAGEVEIFPKQDMVPADGWGNQVVLPLAGASVPLAWEEIVGELVPRGRGAAIGLAWPMSEPVPVEERPEHAARAALPAGEGGLLRELLAAIPNEGAGELDYDMWRNVVFAIHHETGGSDEGLSLAHEFSARSGKYGGGAFLDERVWPFVRSDRGGAVVGLGTLKRLAAAAGWRPAIEVGDMPDVSGEDDRPPVPQVGGSVGAMAVAGEVVERRAATAPPAGPGGPVPLVRRRGIPEARHLMTDQANANRLVKAFGTQVLVAADKWHAWDGTRWVPDESEVYRMGCKLSVIIAEEARDVRARASLEPDPAKMKRAAEVADALMKWAARSEMKGSIEAAIGLARKMLIVEARVLDRDPWALNCTNGTLDLRTGTLRRHDPADYITKTTGVAYRGVGEIGEEDAALWEGVVSDAMRGDAETVGYLQRWAGYCLTGDVSEQALVMHWGTGSNGKSTVLGAISEAMGDYATAAPGELLTAGKGDRHPTELAALMGKRVVTAHESEENVALREGLVKSITGGDKISARYMRGDFFEFDPVHKIQLLTNHKPQVKGTDPGIWRRIHLLAWRASFGTVEQVERGEREKVGDAGLIKRLQGAGAREAVLRWMAEGCSAWLAGGLRAPGAVLEASAAYRSEQDRVSQFLGECCEVKREYSEPVADGAGGGLYPQYGAWCKDGGIFPVSRTRFIENILRLVEGSYVVVGRTSVEEGRRKVRKIQGLRLLTED